MRKEINLFIVQKNRKGSITSNCVVAQIQILFTIEKIDDSFVYRASQVGPAYLILVNRATNFMT